MSAPVFLVEPGELDAAVPGGELLLGGSEGRHAGVVQRRSPGERIDVVDGAGVRVRAIVGSVTPDGVLLRVVERVTEPAPDVRLVLVQALAKGDRDELAIEAATEVGADAVLPWQAERSVVVWRGDRAAKSRARWVATVRTAAKQSRRARVPDVHLAVDTAVLAARVAATVAAGGAALVLHEEARVPLAEARLTEAPLRAAGVTEDEAEAVANVDIGVEAEAEARVVDHGAGATVFVIVGPEGGISDRELARLTDAGAQAVRLGPHVLRTSTAGPVALAILAQRLGRWA